jgi:hypothetical protein
MDADDRVPSRTYHGLTVLAATVFCLLSMVFPQVSMAEETAETDAFDPTACTMEQLMLHATRYGDTAEKRERKSEAQEEFRNRGADALRYLVNNTDIENMWFWIYSRMLVEQLTAEQAMPVLLEAAEPGRPEAVRKAAVYFMAYYDTPQHADVLVPLLDEEKLAGVAIRTLGKWACTHAFDAIAQYLDDPLERRRILAVNALADLHDERAVPVLSGMLDDPVFTVRYAATKGMLGYGDYAVAWLTEALPEAPIRARRHMIQALGAMQASEALPVLEPLVRDADPGIRSDAVRAIQHIRQFEGHPLPELAEEEDDLFVIQGLDPEQHSLF